jgi:predicted aspartyl protease
VIRGSFEGDTARPTVTARVALTTQLVDGEVKFLVDTGAEGTTIAPRDAASLGIDHSQIQGLELMKGISGFAAVYVTRGAVILDDLDQGLCTFLVDLSILAADDVDTEIVEDTPSLLGRDVLDRVRMIYHRRGDGLLIEPTEPDAVV